MRLLITLTAAVLLSACASSDTNYRVAGDQQSGSRVAAEQRHAEIIQSMPTGSELDVPLRVLQSRFPEYPKQLRNANVEGTVRVQFIIEPDGSVSSPQLIGSPQPELAALSLQAILRWKFAPPLKNGAATKVQAVQQFTFKVQ